MLTMNLTWLRRLYIKLLKVIVLQKCLDRLKKYMKY